MQTLHHWRNETQQHIEECTFFDTYKGTLDLSKGGDKLIFWRKVITALKLLKLANKELANKELANKELANEELANKELANKELAP